MVYSMKFLLIPVKRLNRAKSRLSSLLTPDEREALAAAMLTDVLRAASGSKSADRAVVVTNDDRAASLAEVFGLEVMMEHEQHGESASVDAASERLIEMGASEVLRIPGDVPLVTADDLDLLLSKNKSAAPFIAAVPSRDGLGTNALLRNPPNVIGSQFGLESFEKHRQAAWNKKVPFEIYELPRIAHDIDGPDDLIALIDHFRANSGADSESWRAILRLGIADTLSVATGHKHTAA